jgi:hypothetical protein
MGIRVCQLRWNAGNYTQKTKMSEVFGPPDMLAWIVQRLAAFGSET